MTRELLDLLIRDDKTALPEMSAGPYWTQKTWSARRSLRKYGLEEFRSSKGHNVATLSFGDLSITDVRLTLGRSLGARLALSIVENTPLRSLFDRQVALTRSLLDEKERIVRSLYRYANSERLRYLLESYQVDDTINFGCTSTVEYGELEYSVLYLSLLDQLDRVESQMSLNSCTSFLEIGPGFGATMHLIEQNYPLIRKYLLVDIVPNIYVVSEYLRNIYGDAVVDYRVTCKSQSISFDQNADLEIIVIPPWKLAMVDENFDYCWNSNSFVEMRNDSLEFYSDQLARLSKVNTKYAVLTYDRFDTETTLDPEAMIQLLASLPPLGEFRFDRLFESARQNLYFLGQNGETDPTL
jgi:putative sugar O-methyltransferase